MIQGHKTDRKQRVLICIKRVAKISRDQLVSAAEAVKRDVHCFLREQDFAIIIMGDEPQRILDLVAIRTTDKIVDITGTADNQFAAGVNDPPFGSAICNVP